LSEISKESNLKSQNNVMTKSDYSGIELTSTVGIHEDEEDMLSNLMKCSRDHVLTWDYMRDLC
jgi:hypothetical protein